LTLLLGAVVLVLVLTRGLSWLLLWMDSHDWILIPNREAVRNANRELLKPFVEIQSYAEPSKLHLLKWREQQQTRREDATNEGDPPNAT
jgi:hypothetical protein